jgi:senataxin
VDSSTLSSSFLGVISPYREQVYRLQRARRFRDSVVDAATVDGYQGQERDLIVLSTVRANATGQVGFLSDHRRLNVLFHVQGLAPS